MLATDRLELPAGDVDYLVVLGPELRLEVVAAAELRSRRSSPGNYVVFDPAPLRRRLGLVPAAASSRPRLTARTA